MAIIQQPDSLCFSGNLKDFIISGFNEISFILKSGDLILINEVYTADNNRIEISVRDVIEQQLSVVLPSPDDDIFIQNNAYKSFQAHIGSTVVNFIAVKGGIGDIAETSAVFMKTQWLTLQPQQKHTYFNQPEWLNYYTGQVCRVKVKAYYLYGRVEEKYIADLEADKLYTLDVSYSKISEKFVEQILYYDIWIEDADRRRLTYMQRYVLSPTKDKAQVYIFENTLGGIDSVRFEGNFTEKLTTTGIIASLREVSSDSDIDFSVIYKQNTGYLPSLEYARWLRGFFFSKQRYHVTDSFRKIYIEESENSFSVMDLNSYTFEFRYSKQTKYDNVIRNNEDLPELLEFPTEDELFFLAPRLAEFPIAAIADDLFLPAQFPFEDKWRRISVAAIVQAAISASIDAAQGSIDLIQYWKKTELVRDELYLKFLGHKIKSGYSDEAGNSLLWGGNVFEDYLNQGVRNTDIVSFKRIISELQTPGYVKGANGAFVDKDGRIFARSLELFESLIVPELRKNKINVIGEEYWLNQGGLIEEVLDDGKLEDNRYRIRIRLEKNETNPFYEGDICKGIPHTVSGFQSVYFIVVSSRDEPNFAEGIMDVVLTGNLIPPVKDMTFVQCGNVLYVTDESGNTVARYPERQRSILLSARKGYIQFYDKVDSWKISPENIAIHVGECKGVGLPGVPVNAYGHIVWADNIYTKIGVNVIDADGKKIPDIEFKGKWKPGEEYIRNNRVGYRGCMYLCIVDSTFSKPGYDSHDWFLEQGNPDFVMEIQSSNGYVFIGGDVDTNLVAEVQIYNQDITFDIPAAQWTWTRGSSFPDSDKIWNAAHVGTGNSVHITLKDLPGIGQRVITFTCTAFVDNNNKVTQKILI
mgnify:CR=1 FL=1